MVSQFSRGSPMMADSPETTWSIRVRSSRCTPHIATYLSCACQSQFLRKRPNGQRPLVQNSAKTIPNPIENLRVPFKIPNQIERWVLQSNLCNRSHHFCYRSHIASSVRSPQEDYASSNRDDLSKMGVSILNSIRIIECLQRNLSDWEFYRGRGFKDLHL